MTVEERLTMIHCEVDSTVQQGRHDVYEEYRISYGEFVGVVQPHGDTCEFFVRDLRRERPTIHGFRVDFPDAIAAVSQLLNALADKERNLH